MQKLRREICSVWPDDRVEFGVQANGAKSREVAKWFKHRTVKFAAQVDFTSEAIAEAEPDDVVSNVSGIDEANQRLHFDADNPRR